MRGQDFGGSRASLSAWAGDGAVPLLAKSFRGEGAALLIGRIAPGVALRPIDDPSGQRIARCLQRLAHVPASSVHGSLPSGLERLDALIAANARHLRVATLKGFHQKSQERIAQFR
jgi:hypothetical protein